MAKVSHQHRATAVVKIILTALLLAWVAGPGWTVLTWRAGVPAPLREVSGVRGCATHAAKKLEPTEMSVPALTKRIMQVETPQELFDVITIHGGKFDEIHAGASLMQLAKMKNLFTKDVAGSTTFRDLLSFLEFQVCLMGAQTLTNIVWSLAQLNQETHLEVAQLMGAIAERAKTIMKQLRGPDLSNLVYGFAQLGYKDVALMGAAAQRTCQICSTMDKRKIHSVAWGFAELQIYDEVLMEAVAQIAMKDISGLSLRNMAGLASSFTRLNHAHKGLSTAMTQMLVKQSWKDQSDDAWLNRAQILLASSRAGAVEASFIDCIEQHLNPKVMTRMSKYVLAALLWACKEMACVTSHPKLFTKLQEAADRRGITWADIEHESLRDPIEWNRVILGK